MGEWWGIKSVHMYAYTNTLRGVCVRISDKQCVYMSVCARIGVCVSMCARACVRVCVCMCVECVWVNAPV